MRKRRDAAGGSASFFEFYKVLYGERWSPLIQALELESSAIHFSAAPEAEPYFLDSASISAARFLPLPGGEILDACAAPGGKTLVLASCLGEGDRILANELSSDRRRRLSTVLDRHLPDYLRTRVRVSGDDASSMCLRNALRFSSILLDAPCSSERHVLNDQRALDEWTPSRPKSLARRQWSLLASAYLMLKPGGWLVYSTCSLNPGENEEVVARLVGKYGNQAAVDAPTDDPWEKRLYGAIILPDRAAGAGPLYLARIRKPG